MAPAVEVLEGIWGDIELKGTSTGHRARDSSARRSDLLALASYLPAFGLPASRQERLGPVLAEDVGSLPGRSGPDGDRAHQGHIVAQAAKLIPQAGTQQGMGGALACVATGQIVEARQFRGDRWKNCGRGRSGIKPGRQGLLGKGHAW